MFEKIIDSLQQLGVILKIQRSKYGALHALIAKKSDGVQFAANFSTLIL